jgi:hypothetical protein
MHVETYLIRRESSRESTVSIIQAQFTAKACADGMTTVGNLKTRLIEAVTRWVQTTEDGKSAWEESTHDFNLGDLANQDLAPINERLGPSGIFILSIEVHSMDASSDDWLFDTVLVQERRDGK